MRMTEERVVSLYQLMDAAYDAHESWESCRKLGQTPIIDRQKRRGETLPMDPATARRFAERTTAERGNSSRQDNFGGRHVRVRGAVKVMAHLMFGILALCADRLLRLIT